MIVVYEVTAIAMLLLVIAGWLFPKCEILSETLRDLAPLTMVVVLLLPVYTVLRLLQWWLA